MVWGRGGGGGDLSLMTSAWRNLFLDSRSVGMCAWVRQVACVRVCTRVTSVIGCLCRARSPASDLVEIWDQCGRSAC